MAHGFVLHTSVWVSVSPVHVWRRFLVWKPPPQLAEHTDHSLHWVHDPELTLHGACCVSSGSPQVWVLRLTVIPPPQVLVQVVHWLQLFQSPIWVLQAAVWTSGDAEHGFMRLLKNKVVWFTPRASQVEKNFIINSAMHATKQSLADAISQRGNKISLKKFNDFSNLNLFLWHFKPLC